MALDKSREEWFKNIFDFDFFWRNLAYTIKEMRFWDR
jgi:hypothetical protein